MWSVLTVHCSELVHKFVTSFSGNRFQHDVYRRARACVCVCVRERERERERARRICKI